MQAFGWTISQVEETGIDELLAIIEEMGVAQSDRDTTQARDDPWLAARRQEYYRIRQRVHGIAG